MSMDLFTSSHTMGNFWKAFLTALVGSVVANLIILYALRPFVTIPAMPLASLALLPVVSLTIIGVIGATIVYAIMRAFLARPQTPFIWVSIVVLLLSLIPDYLIIGMTTGHFAGATFASASTLMLMHVAAAIITVWALVKMWGAKSSIAR